MVTLTRRDAIAKPMQKVIGTTPSRVSHSMNRFRELGFIEYNGRIKVHKSLLNVVCMTRPRGQNSVSASLLDAKRDKTSGQRRCLRG